MLDCLEPMAVRGKKEFFSIVRDLLLDAEIDLEDCESIIYCYPPPFGILNYLANTDCTANGFSKIIFDENRYSQVNVEIDDRCDYFFPNVGSVKSTKGVLNVGGEQPSLEVLVAKNKIKIVRNLMSSTADIILLASSDKFVRESISGSGENCIFCSVNEKIQERFNSALELISLSSPVMYQVLSDHVGYIVAFSGSPESSSYADLAFQGAIFINLERTKSPITLAADLLHQAAHVYLSIATIDSDKLFSTREDLKVKEAVGGRDERTLYGAFHGLFTAYVEKSFFRSWLENYQEVNDREAKELRQIHDEKAENFGRDYRLFELLRDKKVLIGDGVEILRNYDH